MIGDLSENFSRPEFACRCGCGFDTVDTKLLDYLQMLRDRTEAKITINSSCRCAKHNLSVGGAEKSQHLVGRAADIVVEGMTPQEVYAILDVQIMPSNSGGLKRYNSFVHVDSRPGHWRSP